MKNFEYRETKGFCRMCGNFGDVGEKQAVVSFRSGGKPAQAIFCKGCVLFMKAYIEEADEHE